MRAAERQLSLLTMAWKTAVVHTVTYFVVGLVAFTVLDYTAMFAAPEHRGFMRATSDPLVMAGPLFQPLRGVLFGWVFWLLADRFFGRADGWTAMFVMLLVVGIVSPFGPSPGSIEGMVYTTWPMWSHLRGLPEVVTQSLLLSVLLHAWVARPERRWLGRALVTIFAIALALSTMGLLVGDQDRR